MIKSNPLIFSETVQNNKYEIWAAVSETYISSAISWVKNVKNLKHNRESSTKSKLNSNIKKYGFAQIQIKN